MRARDIKPQKNKIQVLAKDCDFERKFKSLQKHKKTNLKEKNEYPPTKSWLFIYHEKKVQPATWALLLAPAEGF